jgi:SAM-dependent methyltransferase
VDDGDGGRTRRVPVAVADAHALPFVSGAFAGAWADRVVQHLAEPDRALDELVRVVRPGGRLVLADPDYGTQELDLGDDALVRPVLAYRAERALRNGRLAHRHAELLVARGLTAVTVERRTAVVRDAGAMDGVWGLRDWAHAAAESGFLGAVEADAFVMAFDAAVHTGRFRYAVTFFLTAGRVPG